MDYPNRKSKSRRIDLGTCGRGITAEGAGPCYCAGVALEYDEIGIWSEVKLAIVREYAAAYTRILSKQRLKTLYIDAYAGAGKHISRASGDLVDGSPAIALSTLPAFDEYHFVDADSDRAAELRRIKGNRQDVFVYEGDCNHFLIHEIFPRARYTDYKRALCFLDPYNIDLRWEVIEAAGQMNTVELFLNFMIMDINRNALRRNPDKAIASKIEQLTNLWGDESWFDAAYDSSGNLFGDPEKVSNREFEAKWRERLKTKAGFKFVSEPMPMKTKTNAVIYYLYFASQRPVAAGIVRDIFDKYRKLQGF